MVHGDYYYYEASREEYEYFGKYRDALKCSCVGRNRLCCEDTVAKSFDELQLRLWYMNTLLVMFSTTLKRIEMRLGLGYG